MNRFFTLLLAASCLTAVGQNSWNPDSDANGVIGVGDLQSLLSVYGLNWNPDSIVAYGFSELEEPFWCNLHPNNCGPNDRWRQVPEDADVVYWDIESSGSFYSLALPETPRTLVLFGIGADPEFGPYSYQVSNEPTVTNAGWTFGSMRNSRTVAVLSGFNGKWWVLSGY